VYPGIGPGLRALRAAGFLLVIVTNQSGIARGFFTPGDLDVMHRHLRRELQALGVAIDGIYYCPHHRDGVVPALAVDCRCRKPQPGMVYRAQADLDLDLGTSWLVGDILDDVQAGKQAGCRTVLVDIGTEARPGDRARCPDFVARDTPHAFRIIQACEGLGTDADLEYRPPRWAAPEALTPGGAPS
jgi:D-glycero-D-manno-heptose 1,7-bisphosphate phosphatase